MESNLEKKKVAGASLIKKKLAAAGTIKTKTSALHVSLLSLRSTGHKLSDVRQKSKLSATDAKLTMSNEVQNKRRF